MADYKSMYIKLVHAVDNAIEGLKDGLLQAEDIFISEEETILELSSEKDKCKKDEE